MPQYHSPRGLYAFQAQLAAYCIARPKNLAVVDTGLGKGLEKGTGVLRPDGSWTPVELLGVGDHVVGGDGQSTVVLGVFDRGFQPGFEVETDDGVILHVDADHLWTVSTDTDISRGLPWRTVDTYTLSGSVHASDRLRWRLPVMGSFSPPSSDHALDPYVLGVLLGDGHVAAGQVGFTSVDPEIAAIVKDRLPDGCHLNLDIYQRAPRYRIVGSRGVNPALIATRALGVHGCRSWEKFIPAEYMMGSEEDRRALLAGLMDTDGWVGVSQQFTSVSERLARQTADLVRSLGGVARVSSKPTAYWYKGEKHSGRTAYNVTIRMNECPFWLERKVSSWSVKPRLGVTRKIKSVQSIAPIESICIKVAASDGLFVTEGYVVTHNTHIALASACVLLEDGTIDHVLVIAEGNKVKEWRADLASFTDLSTILYWGSKGRRERLRAKDAQCWIMTYEIARNDLMNMGPKGPRGGKPTGPPQPGPLLERFADERLLVVYDEMPMLGGRTSMLHRAQQMLINTCDPRILGLTATPVTAGMESFYNLGRLLCPDRVGSEADFDRCHVTQRDMHGNAIRFRDAEGLAAKMAPVMLRKRKTDPDVIDQFPKLVEDYIPIELADDHMAAYEDLAALIEESDGEFGFNMLTAFANHPRSILHSQAKIAGPFLEMHPSEEIEKLTCSKSEAVIRKIKAISKQGDQVIVFCRHVAVLRELAADLAKAKITVARYDGDFSQSQREAEKARFKDGKATVLLMSKAGEKGINLPEADYVINYDVPLLHSSYIQRYNRGSRIGSNIDGILIVVTYFATGTAEEGAISVWNRRNNQSDDLVDHDVDPIEDEAFVTAQARLAMIRQARTKESDDEEAA